MNVDGIRQALAAAGLDGWLFYDFRGSDPLARGILGLGRGAIQSRRWFYFVPAHGEPVKVVHAIEAGALDEAPGAKRVYLPWEELHRLLCDALGGAKRVAMQYSPNNAIPYVSRVDAGTVELVRSFGVEVVSSADLVQQFEATLTDEQFETHVYAADRLGELVAGAFEEIARCVRDGAGVSEFDIQQHLMAGFEREGLVTDHPPIVAVNEHSADPHYAPAASISTPIAEGDFVLIDLWAKREVSGAIFGDITWTGFVGREIPDDYTRIFEIVRDARDAAIDAVRQAQAAGEPIRGCDVDDVCRDAIRKAGYAEFFIHRTGHSIHEVTHGNGANIDNLETRDERRLIPRTLFSIEPGIYLPGKFGVRSEVDVYLPDENAALVTGPAPQRELVRIC